ncbi:MAG: aa3-type cytochrome c oxidase subunit IV [Sphingomonadaceae bacterium]
MASEGETNGDFETHRESYALFGQLVKWGTVISFGLVFFVVFLLIA